jgi:hypothetical protein
MADRAVAAIASPEVVADLCVEMRAEGIPVSEPEPTDSPADALDSPLSAEEVRQIFETVTVVLQTGTAAMLFRDALRKAVRRHGSPATLQDARTGEPLGRVTHDTEKIPGLDEA